MDKKDMLESLIKHFANGNKRQFSMRLGVTPQTINTWISRNTFDAELIFAKCEYVSGDWLLSGNGDMLKTEQSAAGNTDPATFMQLVDTIRQQAQEIGQLKERIAQLEREGGKDVSTVHSETVARVG